uniref:F-box domain-containing protein n=1 Tax=Strongyloides papillosus TaxID=174720 RepID=A0A0N5BI56_STREA
MDKSTIDFVSLPENFKLQILKKLDWETLKDLKLVCRDFYLTIAKNIQTLGRPKAYSMTIGYDGSKISSVLYRLMLTGNVGRRGSLKHILFNGDDEYENFLKILDFTEIKELCLRNGSNGEYISIHYESNSGGDFSKYNFSTRLPNGRSRKMRLYIGIKSSKKVGILYDGHFLKKESLRKLGLFEEDGSHSVGRKIAMDLLTGNPMLEYENVSANTLEPLDIQIMNYLFKHGFFNPESTCGRKRFKLLFLEVVKFGDFGRKFYRKFFDEIKFNNNLVERNNRNLYSIKSSIKCTKCGVEHENSIFYRRNCKQLCIQSF